MSLQERVRPVRNQTTCDHGGPTLPTDPEIDLVRPCAEDAVLRTPWPNPNVLGTVAVCPFHLARLIDAYPEAEAKLREQLQEQGERLEEDLSDYVEDLVAVGEEIRRVLRPDGSWWLNLGDSFASSWGAQSKDETSNNLPQHGFPDKNPARQTRLKRKSKMLIPHRVAIALEDAGWVVRSDAVWAKPNPMPHPVKDRFREDKEFLFHLTPEPDYWFDLDAIREPHKESSLDRSESSFESAGVGGHASPNEDGTRESVLMDAEDALHPNGKNPGDILEVPVRPFPEAHFAVYPPELVETPLKASCPPKVCAECGAPYERVTEEKNRRVAGGSPAIDFDGTGYKDRTGNHQGRREGFTLPEREVLGWEQSCDCETDETKPGIALDPFAGAGTTCLVAKDLGRRFVGIELNPEYVAIAQKRVGVTVDEPERLLEDAQETLADGGFTNVADVGNGGGGGSDG